MCACVHYTSALVIITIGHICMDSHHCVAAALKKGGDAREDSSTCLHFVVPYGLPLTSRGR